MRERPGFPESWFLFVAVVSLSLPSVDAEVRVWENADGRKIEAEFVKLEAGVVHLKLGNGKIGKVEISKLSEADQELLRNLDKTLSANPEAKPPAEPAAKVEWPNDAGMGIPPDLLQPFVHPPGTARKIGDDYWTPDGRQIWKGAAFRGNGLAFFGDYAKAQTSMNLADAKYGLVNLDGAFVLGGDSAKALPEGTTGIGDPGDNGLTAFSRKVGNEDLWGYMDLDGKVVLEPKWRSAGRFSEGLAAVSETKGRLVQLSSGSRPFLFTGEYKYIDAKGETIIPGAFHVARPFGKDGLAAVWLPPEDETKPTGEAWAFVRRDRSVFVPGDLLDRLAEFRDGRLVTRDAIYDDGGRKIFTAPPNYRLIDAKDDSGACLLASLSKGQPHRLVHRKSGKCYGPELRYDLALTAGFSEGFARVDMPEGKTYGHIDRSGKLVIGPFSHHASDFDGGYFTVSNRDTGKTEYRNGQGELFGER